MVNYAKSRNLSFVRDEIWLSVARELVTGLLQWWHLLSIAEDAIRFIHHVKIDGMLTYGTNKTHMALGDSSCTACAWFEV